MLYCTNRFQFYCQFKIACSLLLLTTFQSFALNCLYNFIIVLTYKTTALCNHNRVVFKGMSSWTALTMHLGMQTTFQSKYMKSKYVRIFIMMVLNFHSIILTLEQDYNPILRVSCCRVLYFFKYAFSLITLRILNLHNKSPKIFVFDTFGLICYLHSYLPC